MHEPMPTGVRHVVRCGLEPRNAGHDDPNAGRPEVRRDSQQQGQYEETGPNADAVGELLLVALQGS